MASAMPPIMRALLKQPKKEPPCAPLDAPPPVKKKRTTKATDKPEPTKAAPPEVEACSKPQPEPEAKGVRAIKCGDSQATAQLPPKELNAAWARFNRSLAPATAASSRTEKVPSEVALKLVSMDDKKRFFSVWMECGQSWATVTAWESVTCQSKNSDLQGWAWLTRAQIQELYKDGNVADAIVKVKEADPKTWRPHPEVPHLAAAIQYLVMAAETKTKEAVNTTKSGSSIQAELDQDAAKVLLPNMHSKLDDSKGMSTTPQQAGAPEKDKGQPQRRRNKEPKEPKGGSPENEAVTKARKWLHGITPLVEQAGKAAMAAGKDTSLPGKMSQ